MRNNEQKEDRRKQKDLLDEFEAPIWAHRHMWRAGLNPRSIEDWAEFRHYCE